MTLPYGVTEEGMLAQIGEECVELKIAASLRKGCKELGILRRPTYRVTSPRLGAHIHRQSSDYATMSGKASGRGCPGRCKRGRTFKALRNTVSTAEPSCSGAHPRVSPSQTFIARARYSACASRSLISSSGSRMAIP